VSRPDKLLQGLRESGIDDEALRKRGGQDLFAVLESLGVAEPRRQLARFMQDQLEVIETKVPSTVSMGPWSQSGTLGFKNRADYAIELADEEKSGTGTISARLLDNQPVTLPVLVPPGSVFEVTLGGVSGRTYIAYRALAKGKRR
jgi:hypothetical protein